MKQSQFEVDGVIVDEYSKSFVIGRTALQTPNKQQAKDFLELFAKQIEQQTKKKIRNELGIF